MTLRHRCFPVNFVKLLRTTFLHLGTTQNKFCAWWQFITVFPFISMLSVHDARKHWNKWKPGHEVGHKFNIWFPESDVIIPSFTPALFFIKKPVIWFAIWFALQLKWFLHEIQHWLKWYNWFLYDCNVTLKWVNFVQNRFMKTNYWHWTCFCFLVTLRMRI